MGALADAEASRLEAILGPWGVEAARLARGEDLREVEPFRDPVSYSEENTFARDVASLELLEQTARAHADAVARRLRRDGLRGRCVVLKLKLGRRVAPGPRGYPLLTRRLTLASPTDDGAVIGDAARALLAKLAPLEPVRLLGVGATSLVSAAAPQLGLFEPSDVEKRRDRLNRALDSLRDRFGPQAVRRGSAGEVDRAGLSLQIKRGESGDASG
jgi:DNA polymerase-4